MAFLFARFAWTVLTLLPGFLRVGVERRLIGTTISARPGCPRILSAADCGKLIPGAKSRSKGPTKRSRRTSDAEVEGDAEQNGRHHKRQKKGDLIEENAYEASHDTETSGEITTPAAAQDIDVIRGAWLGKERARSDPCKTWLEEETWARRIRKDDQVMGPADALRLYKFLGHEERECGPKEEEDAFP